LIAAAMASRTTPTSRLWCGGPTWWQNAAQAVLVVLKDAEVDLEATSRAVGWQVRDWLPTAVSKSAHEPLGSQPQAVEWLEDLVRRLWSCMP
jgi:hypothetical protein